MAKVALGDHAAFEELVTRHQYAVVGTVAKMLGNPSEAEDIAQQVFLRLWKSAPRYKPTAKFTTYLFTITRNLVFNETRRKSRRGEQSLDEQAEDWHQQFEEEEHNRPDEQVLLRSSSRPASLSRERPLQAPTLERPLQAPTLQRLPLAPSSPSQPFAT